MSPSAIEAKVLQIIENVRRKQPFEDSLVELKRQWPDDFPKTARQVAGHANAARGEEILWIIGLDEGDGVTGADQAEFADWWPQVQKHFDAISPDLERYLNIPDEQSGKAVVALLFDTSRSPFVVKDTNGKRLVLWRDGTKCETATRSQLLKILVPLQKLPHLDLIDAHGSYHSEVPDHFSHPEPAYIACDFRFFITPQSREPAYFPEYKAKAELKLGGQSFDGVCSSFSYDGEKHQATVDSAGILTIRFKFTDAIRRPEDNAVTVFHYHLGLAGSDGRSISGTVSGACDNLNWWELREEVISAAP